MPGFRTTTATVSATIATSLLATTLFATSAHADPAPPPPGDGPATSGYTTDAAAATCALDIGLTIKSGNVIKGSGSTSCGTGIKAQMTLIIHKSTFAGYRDVAVLPIPAPSGPRTVSWNCSGEGTDTYYTTVTVSGSGIGQGSNNPGPSNTKTSNSITVSC